MSRIARAQTALDIPGKWRRNNIFVIPLKVVFGDKEYLDGELQPDEFYQRLEESENLPSSSQPAPADFIRLYQDLLDRYPEVISIHLSSG